MRVVLDTTIQIDRILGSDKRIDRINEILYDKELITTTYVLGEYYKNIIQDYITLYNIFLQENDIKQTGCRITENIFGRRQGRIFKLFNNLAASCDYDVELVRDNLQNYLELLQERFYEDIDEILNGTECNKASAVVVYEDEVPRLESVSCTKKMKQCKICEFWHKRRDVLELLLEDRKYAEELKHIIQEGLEDSDCFKGNNCMSLGDTIIVSEAWKLKDISICSSNKKDFQPICDSLNITLCSPDYRNL